MFKEVSGRYKKDMDFFFNFTTLRYERLFIILVTFILFHSIIIKEHIQ